MGAGNVCVLPLRLDSPIQSCRPLARLMACFHEALSQERDDAYFPVADEREARHTVDVVDVKGSVVRLLQTSLPTVYR